PRWGGRPGRGRPRPPRARRSAPPGFARSRAGHRPAGRSHGSAPRRRGPARPPPPGRPLPPRPLVVLLGRAEPVPVPLGEMREGAEVAHSIDVDDPVQMIALVLDHPREKVGGLEVDRLALTVAGLEPYRGPARDDAAHVGNRETTLPAVLRLLAERGDDRVDQHRE